MVLYDPKIHESLLVAWHFHLKEDPEEHEKLFLEPLRNLTNLLSWAAHEVKLLIAWDIKGLTAAAWVEPCLSGAFFGAWLRKDYRTIGGAAFMAEAYKKALAFFPVLIGVTRQERLHELHLSLGYLYLGEVPSLYDGKTARIYVMTQASRDARHDRDRLKPRQSRDNRRSGLAVDRALPLVRTGEPEGHILRESVDENRRGSPDTTSHAQGDFGNNGESRSQKPQRTGQSTPKSASRDRRSKQSKSKEIRKTAI